MSPTSYQTAPPRTSILTYEGREDQPRFRPVHTGVDGFLTFSGAVAALCQLRERREGILPRVVNRDDLIQVRDAQHLAHARIRAAQREAAATVLRRCV